MAQPEHHAGEHKPAMIIARLTAPFGISDIRFKKGGGGKWYPYFDNDAITVRLNSATGNRWDLTMEPWEWRGTYVAAYGHLEIPGLGRRAGVGVQEHQSSAGNEMGADMIKGLRADLLKNCAVAFGCGDQFRSMDPIPFDPDIEQNQARLDNYLRHYFASEPTSAAGESIEQIKDQFDQLYRVADPVRILPRIQALLKVIVGQRLNSEEWTLSEALSLRDAARTICAQVVEK